MIEPRQQKRKTKYLTADHDGRSLFVKRGKVASGVEEDLTQKTGSEVSRISSTKQELRIKNLVMTRPQIASIHLLSGELKDHLHVDLCFPKLWKSKGMEVWCFQIFR